MPRGWKGEIKTLVFDQYGTVVDMQNGLTEIAAPFLNNKRWDGEAHRFVLSLIHISEPTRPY